MDLICAVPHLNMPFESVQSSVKLSSTKCSDGYDKLHAVEIVSRKETDCRITRLESVSAVAHLGMYLESVRIDVKLSGTTGSDG